MMRHSVNNNTRIGLVVFFCSNSNHLISLMQLEIGLLFLFAFHDMQLLDSGLPLDHSDGRVPKLNIFTKSNASIKVSDSCQGFCKVPL